ncbi:MAG: Nif3-like dinuclear metal center hexameric protein [Candidatus Hodarchaeales archaeon]|jgi:hypothetical protein
MNTDEIVKISLDLVNMSQLPADSEIFVPGDNIKKVLYGIDIGVAELAYAKENNYDCVIAHHPHGVNMWRVFWKHLDQMKSKGIPEEEAQAILEKKVIGFKYGAHARNYDAIPSFARLIKLPFLNIHCPSDELGRRLITDAIKNQEEQMGDLTLKGVKNHLEDTFKEFQKAKTKIEVAKGNMDDLLGNWIFSHGALTNGGYALADCYYKNGVDTVIYIHIAPGELSQILKLDIGQLMIAGHLVSDSIGINPLLDRLEEQGVEITAIGGLIR